MDKLHTLKIKLLDQNSPLPQKQHVTDSGIDLTLVKVIEKRKNIFFFDLGIAVEPPKGYYTELYPRSSIYKYDFIMANSVGIIDADYRGAICMPMRYLGLEHGLQIAESLIGQRVAQLILKKLEPLNIKIVTELSETQRDQGGFGSTGS